MAANLSFGSFELRPSSRQLLADGQEVELGTRAFDVLHALIQRRERVVSKQELLDLAWPGLVVEENNLQVQISTLRKILGQQAIVTVQGRGYQFTLEVFPSVAAPSRNSTSAATSVAVARLVPRDDDPETIRFAATLTRDLVARLGRIHGYTGQMRVLALESDPADDVADLGEQGRELHARYVVVGTVLRSGRDYSIRVQLIDATNNGQVWSYQDTLQDDSVALESSIKFANLSRRVRAAIVDAEMRRVLAQPIPVLSGEELALRALATWKKESMTLPSVLEARRLADQALEVDPNLVPALLIRVYLMDQEYGLDPDADRRRIAREIDNDTARALKLDPANETAWAWRAFAQLYLGRWDAASEAIDRAIELDPDNSWLLGNRALILNLTGDPTEGLAAIDRARAADPSDSAQAALVACHSYLLLGQPERAATMGEKCAIFGRVWNVQVLLVAAYANQGDCTKANAAKTELLRFVPGFTIAQARGYDEPAHPEYARLAEKYIYDGLRKAGIPETLGPEAMATATNPERGYELTLPPSQGTSATTRSDSFSAAAPPASLRLAVAVLPFVAFGRDPDADSIAEELTRRLTAALTSELRMTEVVSRDLVASYKNKSIDPRSVGRELDASYLVVAEARRFDTRVEVNAQLIDTANATQLWSEPLSIDYPPQEKEIAVLLMRLAERVENVISYANERRYAGPPAPNASPLELTWHAYATWQTRTLGGALTARKCFDQALRVDPNFLPAILGRWLTLHVELHSDPKAAYSRILREMDELSARAINIDNSDSDSWQFRAATLVHLGRLEAALEANSVSEKLISSGALGPATLGQVLNQRAGVMLLMGRPEVALELVERALALDPQSHEVRGWIMLTRARACMALGRYEEVIAACETGLALENWLMPRWLLHLYLVASYALMGNLAKAASEKTALLEFRPGTSIANFKGLYWSDNPAFVQQTETHLLAGLRNAEFPELPGSDAIVTIPGRGYEFTLDPSQGTSAAPPNVDLPLGVAPTSTPPMSIAIMPFTARRGSTADEQLADALSRDITTGLARDRSNVLVTSHSAAASYKGNPIDARAVGRELHVRYVAEGEIRRAGKRVIVSVQLVDTRDATQAWSEQFELEPVHPGEDESSFSRRLTSELRYALFTTEMRRAASAAATSPIELVARAHAASNMAYTPQAMRDAGKLLDDALRLEPNLVPALNERVWILWNEFELDVGADRDRMVQSMDDLSSRAVNVDNGDAYTWMTRGFVLGLQGRWESALAANDLARRLDPTRRSAIVRRAWLMYLRGEPNEALALLQEAHAVFREEDPEEVRLGGMANLMLGRCDDAIAMCERSAGISTWYVNQLVLAAAYANKDDRVRAAAAKGELDRLVPGYSIAVWKAKRYSQEPAFLQQSEEHLLAGLRKAGFPEV